MQHIACSCRLHYLHYSIDVVSNLGQKSTLHSFCVTLPEFVSIQLVSDEHLGSMALCLKNRLANVFLIYILLQLVTSRCEWTVLRSQVGGWMVRMNLRGRGTMIFSVLMQASTGSKISGMRMEQIRRQISLVLCSRNYILFKVLKADPMCTLQWENNTVRSENLLRYYSGNTAYRTTYPAGWASWHSPFDWKFALGLLSAT